MLNIFATPKSFLGHIGIIQTNAIQSWLRLRPTCEVTLFGNEKGTAEVASRLGVRHIPDVDCNEYGTPLINSVFSIAQEFARYQLMCFVNADTILMSDFLPAVQRIHKHPFLMIGQRWDLDLGEPLDFDDTKWEPWLRARLAEHGKLHPDTGICYFVFTRGLYEDAPALAIGRTGDDNWIVYKARSLKVPVVDATKVITAVHQNHDYSHHPQGEAGVWKGPEAERNRELLGGSEYSLGIRNATWLLTPKGMKRAYTLRHFYYQLNAIPVLVPRLHFLEKPRRMLIAFSKTIRSILGIARE